MTPLQRCCFWPAIAFILALTWKAKLSSIWYVLLVLAYSAITVVAEAIYTAKR